MGNIFFVIVEGQTYMLIINSVQEPHSINQWNAQGQPSPHVAKEAVETDRFLMPFLGPIESPAVSKQIAIAFGAVLDACFAD